MANEQLRFTELVKLLEMYGQQITDEMRTRLKNAGKIDSGSLYNSVHYEVVGDVNPTLVITADDYGVRNADEYGVVNSGRRPGTYPPGNSIKAWMRRKGIPKEAYWPIMKKIKERGIRGTGYFTISANRRVPQLQKDMENVLSYDVQKKLDAFANKINATK